MKGPDFDAYANNQHRTFRFIGGVLDGGSGDEKALPLFIPADRIVHVWRCDRGVIETRAYRLDVRDGELIAEYVE